MICFPNAPLLLLAAALGAQDAPKAAAPPSFDYGAARAHEIKPHRRTIPVEGANGGFNQLRLTLVVSPLGDVVQSSAAGDPGSLEHWPQLQSEVNGWKFEPFQRDGKPVTAEVEEYVDLVPPERLPKTHVAAPPLKPTSRIAIVLRRTGCFGTCPSYQVTVRTDGVIFEGEEYVVATGTHKASIEAATVRELAKKFIAADFYSMDSSYVAAVTDNPSYTLSIDIDGRAKQVEDYVGAWVGMPQVISALEEEVDEIADTARWVAGSDGLVDALAEEKFSFKSVDAQAMLKAAARNGQTQTVEDLLDDGVPLEPLPAPKQPARPERFMTPPDGWLVAAARHPETLQVLIDAAASEHDQKDKDLALVEAASAGQIASVRALIDYGANPNADLGRLMPAEDAGGKRPGSRGSGSLLYYAAASGSPEMVQEFLRYHPDLEARGPGGKTALFATGDDRSGDEEKARAECARLLLQAGADINARDERGNTPLHEIYLTEVEEELVKAGADVNARNDEGETPIFTNVDNDSIALFLAYGADLNIRNKKGQTVFERAKEQGPGRLEALQKAVAERNQPQ